MKTQPAATQSCGTKMTSQGPKTVVLPAQDAATRQKGMATAFIVAAVLTALPESTLADTGDFGRFRHGAGFDADQRYMIDPIGGSRDENGNLVRTGGLSNNSAAQSSCGLSAAAIGNFVSVVVDGNNNTVIVEANQHNSGAIQASTVLNGKIQFPC